jgi:hypothetical protein
VIDDVPADPPALPPAGALVAAIVQAAVDPSLVDVVRDLFEPCVAKMNTRRARLVMDISSRLGLASPLTPQPLHRLHQRPRAACG